jgi:hypothetical protein
MIFDFLCTDRTILIITSYFFEMTAYNIGDLATYVAAAPDRDLKHLDCVLLDMKHNLLKAQYKEIKFPLSFTVYDVKKKIYTMTGSQPGGQHLALDGIPMTNDDMELRAFRPRNRSLLTCTDTDPFSLARGGQLEDVSLVRKYVMSDEDYDKREKTVRKFIEQKRKADPNWRPPIFRPTNQLPPDYRNLSQIMNEYKVGDRCECFPGGRRGVIMWIGHGPEEKTEEKVGSSILKERPTISVNYKSEEPGQVAPDAKLTTAEPEREFAGVKEEESTGSEFGTAMEEKDDEPYQQVWIGVKFDENVGRNDGVFRVKLFLSYFI